MSLNKNVSVVIPVYNAASFIKRAVESALMQAETGEVILVEDGSQDGSLKLCIELEKQYDIIRLFYHPHNVNKGASASRNLGITKAGCDYIAFLDADDYYLPFRFKADKKILENQSEVDGVYNALGSELLDDYAREHKKNILTTITENLDPAELFYRMGPLGNSGWFSGDALTVRKKIFENVGFYDESLQIGEDTHLWFRMAIKAKLVGGEIKHPVAIRGIHVNNTINNGEKFQIHMPFMFKAILEWCINECISDDKKFLLWERYSFYKKKMPFLFISIFKYPFLLKQKSFWQKWPIINSILK